MSIGDTEYASEVLETFGLKVDSFFLFWGRGKMDTLLSILLITILGGVKLLSILPISNFLVMVKGQILSVFLKSNFLGGLIEGTICSLPMNEFCSRKLPGLLPAPSKHT